MKKLSKNQQEILDRLRSGEKCHFQGIGHYWFMSGDYKKCSKQINVLRKLGYIKTKGFGISLEIESVTKCDAVEKEGEQ